MKKVWAAAAIAALTVFSAVSVSADYEYGDIECSLNGTELSADDLGKSAGAAYVGVYSDGRLIDLQMPQITDGHIDAVIKELDSADTVKVFFWENSDNMKPVSAYTIDLEQSGAVDAAEKDHEVIAVSEVSAEADAAGDHIAVIKGYSGGTEVSYRITPFSAAYSAGENVFSGSYYETLPLWDPSEGDTVQSLSEKISAGDIVLIDGDAAGNVRSMVVMAKAEAAADTGWLGWAPNVRFEVSAASEGWINGNAASVTAGAENQRLIRFGGSDDEFVLDSDAPVDLIELDGTGVRGETITADEIITSEEDGRRADVLVLKTYRGHVTGAFVYRFAD